MWPILAFSIFIFANINYLFYLAYSSWCQVFQGMKILSLNSEEIFGRPKTLLWSSFLWVDVNTAVLEHGDKVETILLRTCFFLPGVLGSVLIVRATAFPKDCLELYEDSEDKVLVAGFLFSYFFSYSFLLFIFLIIFSSELHISLC